MAAAGKQGTIAVIWIDWYAYHVARFRALTEHRDLRGRLAGIELVGGAGVHQGLVFREKPKQALPVTTLVPDKSWSEAGQFPLARQVWRTLSSLQPDVVLVPGYYTLPGLGAALWCRFHGKRSVLMTESTQFDHHRTGWKETLKSLLLRALFDRAVAGGKAHLRYLEALKFPLHRVGRNYDVVDNAFFRRETATLRAQFKHSDFGLPSEYFLYVGRLAQEKNIEGLLREFAAYRNGGGRWSLVLAGDGPRRQALIELTRTLKVEDFVLFTGQKTSSELPPYYSFAKCFVLASIREPWGLVVNEAMAAGLPVLVSDRCGCAEDLVQPEVNGWIFRPSAPGELAARMNNMEQASSAELSAMQQASLRIIDGYSLERWAGEVARIVAA